MYLSIKKPVTWRKACNISHHIIPSELRDFLLDPGSTTKRMQREYATQTKVTLLTQQWLYPHYHEAQLLNIPLRQYALIREVYLSCQDKIWMYARTVFPNHFFTGKNTRIKHELDHRPLGKLLFRDPTMQRSEFELALLNPEHLEYQWAMQQHTPETADLHLGTQSNLLWGRRSIIHLQQKPLLLMEIIFPTFLELKKVKS